VGFVASALGYLLAPAAMLRTVGIPGDPMADLLVRILVAAPESTAPVRTWHA
jgi:hypothetical protein